MVTMGHELGLDVVAEGVETEQHRDFLRELECDYMQGYLWTPPRSYGELQQYLASQDDRSV
jgi:EAL domain-containing protein (putative c-di-GMP-specific phosphodiesterase class I)